jgi:tRNA (mo5U34)-methyltransferase
MEDREVREHVEKIKWFHSIDLGHGIVTPGCDRSAAKLKRIHLPGDLTGRTVLDIGAWDGFFSFEAERRGAQRVVAADYFCWSGEGWGTKEGFDLSRRVLDSRVEDCEIDVFDLSPERVGLFDVVLFLGVLYHLKYPQAALERVASVTTDLLILETHVDHLDTRSPVVAFYPDDELDEDPTNWCGPNPSALEWMLRDVGFTDVKPVFQSSPWWRAGRAAKLALRRKSAFLRAYRQGRVVYHARKG